MTQPVVSEAIDIHAHIAPLSFLREISKLGHSFGVEVEETSDGYVLTFPNLPRLRPAGGSLAETHSRLEWMGHQGVGTQYLAAWLDIQGYSLPKDKEAQWVRLLNEHIAQTAQERSGRFRALAAVPLRDGELAARELEHAITSLDMIGAMVASDPLDIDVADSSMEPLWEAAEALNVPLLLHGATHSKWTRVGPPYLAFSLGRTLDTTVLAAKLVLGGLLDRHPNLKLVLCHGGGFLPYQIGRIQGGYKSGSEKVVDLKLDGPEAYLPLLYYDTVTLNPRSLRLLLDLAGPEHVMLGSDYVWRPMGAGLMDAVEAAQLDPQTINNIYHHNATRLFGK
jgi:aminocarboxymuconate-semialdehyde decarboxylase